VDRVDILEEPMKLVTSLLLFPVLSMALAAPKPGSSQTGSSQPPVKTKSTKKQPSTDSAPPPADKPVPAPEMKRLIKMWTGHWTTDENFAPSDQMPHGGQGKGMETMRPGPGSLSLIGDYQTHGAPFGHLVVIWLPKEQAYKSYWTDSTQPGVSVQTGRWEGDRLVFTSVDESSGKKIESRDTYSDITPNSFTDQLDSGPEGEPLKRVLTVKYTRQK
jgi:hypothetical protein